MMNFVFDNPTKLLFGTGKGKIAPNKPLPIVTIATSPGTVSEMNEWDVICKEDIAGIFENSYR